MRHTERLNIPIQGLEKSIESLTFVELENISEPDTVKAFYKETKNSPQEYEIPREQPVQVPDDWNKLYLICYGEQISVKGIIQMTWGED